MIARYAILLGWCWITAFSAKAATPTFAEHIAPIIWKNCVSCHRSGEIAPFSLTNYPEVSSRAQSIKYATSLRSMPPWKPQPGYGSFADERRLTQQEIDLIAQWADAGAPEGDASKTPPLPKFTEGSQLGTPDLVVKMSEAWHQKGDNKDVYRNFVLPTNLLQNRTVSAIEFRPGNKKIVHHALIFVDTAGAARKLDEQDPLPGYSGFGGAGVDVVKNLLGWVPGATPRFFPQGLGIILPKGSDIILQLHYAPSATEEEDQSSINIFFAKETAQREIEQVSINPVNLLKGPFVIPADSVKHFVGTIKAAVIRQDVSIMAVAPHMHLLGKDCRAYAVTPKGDTIKLVRIEEWDFHWQGYYMVKNLVKVPKNSTIYYEASYDNTADNPENPNNPPIEVRWGESTYDEMFLCYLLYIPYRAGDENISLETPLPVSVAEEEHTTQNLFITSLYPNPADQHLFVQLKEQSLAPLHIEIRDVMGRVVWQGENTPDSGNAMLRIELPLLPIGSYNLRTSDGINTASATVVVMR